MTKVLTQASRPKFFCDWTFSKQRGRMRAMSRIENFGCLVVFVLSSLLAACSSDDDKGAAAGGAGSGSAGSPSNGLPDPCKIPSASDLETVTGESSLTGETSNNRCDWYTPSDDGVINLTLYANSTPFDTSKGFASIGTISGVGTEAFLGVSHDVWVKLASGKSFLAQAGAVNPTITASTEIKAAAKSVTDEAELNRYEASYRFAKIVATKF